jgi:hypothetical protein
MATNVVLLESHATTKDREMELTTGVRSKHCLALCPSSGRELLAKRLPVFGNVENLRSRISADGTFDLSQSLHNLRQVRMNILAQKRSLGRVTRRDIQSLFSDESDAANRY